MRRLLIEAEIPNTTNTAIAYEIEAMNKAAEHGGDPRGGLLGYSASALMAIFNRARRGMYKKRKSLENEKKKAADRRHREWKDAAKGIKKHEADLTWDQVAKRIVEAKTDPDEPGSVNYIKRIISKK